MAPTALGLKPWFYVYISATVIKQIVRQATVEVDYKGRVPSCFSRDATQEICGKIRIDPVVIVSVDTVPVTRISSSTGGVDYTDLVAGAGAGSLYEYGVDPCNNVTEQEPSL